MGCLNPVAGGMGAALVPSSCLNVFKMHQGDFCVSMLTRGDLRLADTYTRDRDVDLMPNIDVNSPVSSVPTDRLALGGGWVRPGLAGIGGSLNPSPASAQIPGYCFEGSEE